MTDDGEELALAAIEAGERFAELLARVERGEEVTILDAEGVPLALLTPHPDRPPSAEEVAMKRAAAAAAVERVLSRMAAEAANAAHRTAA